MKTKKIVYILAAASTCAFALASCGDDKKDDVKFDYSITLASGKTSIELGSSDQVKITTNGQDDADRTYTYSTSNVNRATVSDTGYVSAVGVGSVVITVNETKSGLEKTMEISPLLF